MNYGKKKMMYGGKVKKKMAQGGTTRTQSKIKDLGPNKGTKRVTKDEKMSVGAIAAAIDSPKTFGKGVKYNTKSTIPTKQGTDMDKKSKRNLGMNARELLNKEKQREKKSGGSVKKMTMGGKMKPVDKAKNPGLAKLPTDVRNKMGFMKKGGGVKKSVPEGLKKAAMKAGELGAAIMKVKKKQGKKAGGMAKKKMMGGGMAMKYKKGGMTKKCPRDGIAMRGKTRA